MHFRPGGAFPFLRMPAGEMRDTTVSLDTLWGAGAVDLRDQLLEAPTHQARFEILERVLSDELARGFQPKGAVGFALRRFMAEPHVTTVAGVTDQIGLSPKRFIQLFRDQTGFTPKVFCRIRRFQQALDHMEGRVQRRSSGPMSHWIAVTSIRRTSSTISAPSPGSIRPPILRIGRRIAITCPWC